MCCRYAGRRTRTTCLTSSRTSLGKMSLTRWSGTISGYLSYSLPRLSSSTCLAPSGWCWTRSQAWPWARSQTPPSSAREPTCRRSGRRSWPTWRGTWVGFSCTPCPLVFRRDVVPRCVGVSTGGTSSSATCSSSCCTWPTPWVSCSSWTGSSGLMSTTSTVSTWWNACSAARTGPPRTGSHASPSATSRCANLETFTATPYSAPSPWTFSTRSSSSSSGSGLSSLWPSRFSAWCAGRSYRSQLGGRSNTSSPGWPPWATSRTL